MHLLIIIGRQMMALKQEVRTNLGIFESPEFLTGYGRDFHIDTADRDLTAYVYRTS